jgi:TBC1 domain family member 20
MSGIFVFFFCVLSLLVDTKCYEKSSPSRRSQVRGNTRTVWPLHVPPTYIAEPPLRTSPLPFHALSNLLTLFSHDMPTLPLIQHVFDYLLCRPPIAVVYLASAVRSFLLRLDMKTWLIDYIQVILSRKLDVERLQRDDDDTGIGMAHSLLNALPEISDDLPVKTEELPDDEGIAAADSSLKTIKVEVSSTINVENLDLNTTTKQEDDISDRRLSMKMEDPGAYQSFTNDQPAEHGAGTNLDAIPSTPVVLKDELDTLGQEETTTLGSRTLEGLKHSEDDLPSMSSPTNTSPCPQSSIPPSPSNPSRRRSSTTATLTPLTLSSLLTHADALSELYPPAHPGLGLSSIMGPQSVMYTWREPSSSFNAGGTGGNESEEERLADDEAEAMVARSGLVVYPFIEEDEDVDVDSDQTLEEEEDGWGWWSEKKAKPDQKPQSGKGKARNGKGKEREKRRPRKLRKNPLSRVEKRTMLAGAVLVLGVAMAIYGNRVGRGSSWDVHGREWREWRMIGSWVGGALVGVADRMVALSGMKD